MKLLTINTHSIIEENYEQKCEYFVDAITRIKPDIIAMQEVNQSRGTKIVGTSFLSANIPLREDNHALKIHKMLLEKGINYSFVWLGIKYGYEIFEEGLSIFSLKPINSVESLLLSKCDDINNWKTRKALILKIDDFYVCNVHMGWWNDEEEPFFEQFKRLGDKLSKMNDRIFLLGDFNSPADEKHTGYEKVLSDGWLDTYSLAENKDSGFTVTDKIDGWENKTKKRIDYIFTNKKIPVKSSKVIFNGENEKIISDHFGVIIEI